MTHLDDKVETSAPHKPEEQDETTGIERLTDAMDHARERMAESREELLERLGSTMHEIKPRLRGWFHLFSAPLAVIGGLILLVFTPTLEARASVAVFVFASIMLFSVSATYHRTNGWVSPRLKDLLQRTDHASISILIAGTATPFAVLLLEGKSTTILLTALWIGTGLAVASKYLFAHPPRWINVPIYIVLGWFPIMFMGEFYDGAMAFGPNAGIWIITLILAGGVMYSIGGILFGFRPKWLEIRKDVLGFHEIFHAFTIAAFACHYAAISIVAYMI